MFRLFVTLRVLLLDCLFDKRSWRCTRAGW
jgi:hypothetical protein